MSYSFKVEDGDLTLLGDQLNLVFGVNKLNQDLELWLRERYGVDRFHTNFGSVLQDFIGGIVTNSSRLQVVEEVERVLQNYQNVQARTLRDTPSKLSESELLYSIDGVRATLDFDTVNVSVRIRNGLGQSATIAASQSS